MRRTRIPNSRAPGSVLGAKWGPGVEVTARVTHFEVVRTEPAFGGQQFGNVGAYERVWARAYGVLDPADPKNAIIQDLNLAPRAP
ncbi:MAG: hypothetical protein JOY71_17080 [Acetobacteraceae bacterium]|nr:hypothetical protein [Acetobacteraceae bacterium]MBV8523808.1 hypothetical protein [Acetobacteraceae bacterium]